VGRQSYITLSPTK